MSDTLDNTKVRHIVVNKQISDEEKNRHVDNAFNKEILNEFLDEKDDEDKIIKYKFFPTLKRLYLLNNKRDKIHLLLIFLATLFLSLMETVGISVIMPFITLASNPERIHNNKYSSFIYDFLGFDSNLQFMLTFSVILILFYVFRAAYHIFYSYITSMFSFYKYHNFALKLFAKSLEITYLKFTFTNKDKLRQIVTGEASNTAGYIQNVLSLFSEFLTILLLYGLLLAVNWKMTLVLTIILSVKIALISKMLNKIIADQGQLRTKLDQRFLGLLSRSFGNFKMTKLRGNQDELYQIFAETSLKRGKSSILVSTLTPAPKNILETVGFSILIASVAYILVRYDDAQKVLPTISMYALALYRLLPSVSSIMNKFQNMIYNQNSVNIVYEALHGVGEQKGLAPLDFKDNIILKDIDFSYSKDKPILQKISLEIKRGEKVAFVGPSGAGKSTLVDLIIGIYHPKGGKILIDGEELAPSNIDSWRKKVGYIPQQIFLYDGTVAQNVAFGEDEDEERIKQACKKANIYDFLESNNGIKTRVGDGGIRLSGGQLQRIGIARALYTNPQILVLDEATSALDTDTESKIMDEIYKASEDKTLLIIAHRLSTIERCNVKIRVEPIHKT